MTNFYSYSGGRLMGKRKVLIVLANEFPFGKNEAYMEAEVKYWKKFDAVFLLSLQLGKKSSEVKREIPENIKVIPVRLNIPAYILYIFRTLLDANLYSELHMLINNKNFSLRTIAQVFLYISRAHYESDYVRNILKDRISINDDLVFYSYRFGYQPYVAILLNKKLAIHGKIYSRAHGYDLYENRKKSGYIPMRNLLLKKIVKCFPCSENGSKYLRDRYPLYKNKIETRYLGTEDHGVNISKRDKEFQLVSCSNISEVKRIHLIVDALSSISDQNIKWTHYGSGPLSDTIKGMASKKLPPNVKVEWKGSVSNNLILDDYGKGNYNLFVNVSSSEGLPVSIMEATSAGIPCIATDVGGTSELIKNSINGFLMNEDVSPEDIAANILRFIKMSDEQYERFCENARNIWKEKFSADVNYQKFVDELYNS